RRAWRPMRGRCGSRRGRWSSTPTGSRRWWRAATSAPRRLWWRATFSRASAFDDWLAAERLQWRRRSLDALVRHSEALIAAGRVAEASDAAQRALALDATCSAAMRALLRARALAGDRAGALKQYDAF